MNKLAILTACLIYTLCCNSAFAQDNLKIAETNATKKDTRLFNIKSIDGKNIPVKIIPDYVNRILKITCLKDTIRVNDFWGVPPEIHLLNKNFIEIKYAVRGGSNLGLGNMLIVCLNEGKLYQAMHTLWYINSDYGDLKTDYHLKTYFKGDNKTNFKLRVLVHDDVYSKKNPETSYVYNNQTVLNFDTKRNVFFNIKESIYDHFAETGKSTKQKIDGNFPVIILGKETYYYISSRWYQSGSSKEMIEVQ